MTLPAPTVPRPARAEDALPGVTDQAGAGQPRRHRGCYWDLEQAAWVRFTRVPLPREALD